MEKLTYNFSRDFNKVFEALAKGIENVQFAKVPVRAGKTYSCEQYMIKYLSSAKSKKERREIVIFTTEKNILADSSYMHVL